MLKYISLVVMLALLSTPALAKPRTLVMQARTAPTRFDPIQQIKDDFQKNTGVKPTGNLINDLLKALDNKMLPDLQYALLLANATGNKITAPCWTAWIAVINTQQTAVKDKDDKEIPAPDPSLFTTFEKAVELRNMLQPDSAFMVSCSPVANLVKQDVISFMGKVISGGAGLTAMGFGL